MPYAGAAGASLRTEIIIIQEEGMTRKLDMYKCEVCGNIVQIYSEGAGELVCCNQAMKLLDENTVDAALEKHVPVVEETPEGIVVNVGSVDHPMEEKHYIQWIEVIGKDTSYTAFLHPGDAPRACFPKLEGPLIVREYCNLHGLWKA